MPVPNVLLIVLDTARSKTVLSGIESGLMPALKRIADEGTVYTNASSVAPWTLPSHASIFTGQYTGDHGTHANSREFVPSVTPVAEQLSREGYRTAGISANPWISPVFNFDRGFENFSMRWNAGWSEVDLTAAVRAESPVDKIKALWEQSTMASFPSVMFSAVKRKMSSENDDGAKRITDRAVNWIKQVNQGSAPFFLFLNYIEPHLPYDPPQEYIKTQLPNVSLERIAETNQDPWGYIAGTIDMEEHDFEILRGLYRAELSYLDTQLSRLFSILKDKGILEETMIVVVGDHGENIGEHGLMDHQYCLYETLLNVPLIIRYPQRFEADICDNLVETRDLYPTLLDVAGVSTEALPETVSKISLPNRSREYVLAQYVTPQPTMESLKEKIGTDFPTQKLDRSIQSVRNKRWKYIEYSDGSIELFDLTIEQHESKDHAKNIEIRERFRGILEEKFQSVRHLETESFKINDESKQRLEDLGYI
ncbi:sulfatase [Halegenticoccus tardaugens]|uniref:sulfatase n=1 Tax=Halegenticoccus tardaugens TaxID=2071624 RepID=UPI00100B06E2|nr:sulfatase [Halegenticoccus tardaugens]